MEGVTLTHVQAVVSGTLEEVYWADMKRHTAAAFSGVQQELGGSTSALPSVEPSYACKTWCTFGASVSPAEQVIYQPCYTLVFWSHGAAG